MKYNDIALKMKIESQMENDVLSEEYIREVMDYVAEVVYCEYQELSEDFMREFKDKVSWIIISSCQRFSFKFAKEFKTKLNWALIQINTKIEEPERTKIVKFLQNPKNF